MKTGRTPFPNLAVNRCFTPGKPGQSAFLFPSPEKASSLHFDACIGPRSIDDLTWTRTSLTDTKDWTDS